MTRDVAQSSVRMGGMFYRHEWMAVEREDYKCTTYESHQGTQSGKIKNSAD